MKRFKNKVDLEITAQSEAPRSQDDENHSNLTEGLDKFVKEIRVNPNMAPKLRAVGSDPWFKRSEVHRRFKWTERSRAFLGPPHG